MPNCKYKARKIRKSHGVQQEVENFSASIQKSSCIAQFSAALYADGTATSSMTDIHEADVRCMLRVLTRAILDVLNKLPL